MAKKNLPKSNTPTTPKPSSRQTNADIPPGQSLSGQRHEPNKPDAAGKQPARPSGAPALSTVTSTPGPKAASEVASLLPAAEALKPARARQDQESSRSTSRPSAAKSMQGEAAPSVSASSAAASHQTIGITFSLVDRQARQVSVCGDFNDWRPNVTPLTRKADGRWETTLALRPGRYQYKFVADDRWLHDPKAQENVPNLHGSLNSVVEVRV